MWVRPQQDRPSKECVPGHTAGSRLGAPGTWKWADERAHRASIRWASPRPRSQQHSGLTGQDTALLGLNLRHKRCKKGVLPGSVQHWRPRTFAHTALRQKDQKPETQETGAGRHTEASRGHSPHPVGLGEGALRGLPGLERMSPSWQVVVPVPAEHSGQLRPESLGGSCAASRCQRRNTTPGLSPRGRKRAS